MKQKDKEYEERTKLGVKYTSQMAVWKDRKGNQLTLISIINNAEQGTLILESAEKVKANREAEKKADKARRF